MSSASRVQSTAGGAAAITALLVLFTSIAPTVVRGHGVVLQKGAHVTTKHLLLSQQLIASQSGIYTYMRIYPLHTTCMQHPASISSLAAGLWNPFAAATVVRCMHGAGSLLFTIQVLIFAKVCTLAHHPPAHY
jgi:hypothetical protein